MKKRILFMITLPFLLFVMLACSPDKSPDQNHTRWKEGVKARLGKGDIDAIVYSPDGTRLAGAGSIGVWIYDARTGEELDLLIGHTQRVSDVSFSPDGQTIATGSVDQTVRLWNAETGENIRTLIGHTFSVFSVSFSPGGQTIASVGSTDTVRLWNAETGENIRTFIGDFLERFDSVSFSPDGQTIATGSNRDTVRLWDVETGKNIRTLAGHTSSVDSVSFR